MAWHKTDDKLHDHRKVLKLLRTGPGRVDVHPLGLWIVAGAWAADNRTDGFVPAYLLDRWDDDAECLASRLVAAGLWEPSEVDGDDGYQFHDWGDYQPMREQLETEAARKRRQNELSRDPELVAQIKKRDGDRCRYCGAQVNFADRKSTVGGTYDHVDPEGPNNFANVVTACRGCNSAKKSRTPEQWGTRLLPPGSTGPKRSPLRPVAHSPSEPDSDSIQIGADSSQMGQGRARGSGGAGPGRGGSGRAGPGLDTNLPRSESEPNHAHPGESA